MRHEWSSSVNHSLGKGDEKERKFTLVEIKKSLHPFELQRDQGDFGGMSSQIAVEFRLKKW